MPWLKLDDRFTDDPRIDALSDAAVRLHVAAFCYSARNQTDGIVPADRVPRLVPRFKKQALTDLVDGGLWRELAEPDAYELADYLEWNDSRADIEEKRKRKSESGRKGAQRRWQT